MELTTFSIPKSDRFVLAPLGDIQYNGPNGSTAEDHLKRHIDRTLEMGAYYCGLGDYGDFLSPSNRQRLINAGLYDTAQDAIAEKAYALVEEIYEKFLKPTTGRWIGMVEGHHFFQSEGRTTDELLAEKLKTKFLGTSAFIKIPRADLTVYLHHGNGGGKLPGATLNRAYHVAAGLQGADIYVFGHDTKLGVARLSRPFPVWGKKQADHRLEHRDIWLVSSGSFSKSNIVGHKVGAVTRGDYAEAANMTPSPLSAPIITVDLTTNHDRIRVSI
jgi:hypothetical protein